MPQVPQDTPGLHGLCNPALSVLDRLHTIIRLYTIVMPSTQALDLGACGGVLRTLASDDRVRVMAWMVNDADALAGLAARTTERVSHVISDAPLALVPQCAR